MYALSTNFQVFGFKFRLPAMCPLQKLQYHHKALEADHCVISPA
jgi:hypothetical protein